MSAESKSLKIRVIAGIAVLTILHVVTLFLPFTVHTHLNDAEDQVTFTYTNINQTVFMWIFVANYLIVVTAAATFSRVLATVLLVLVSIWTFLLHLAFSYLFVWDGQPIHASFGSGYFLNQLILLTAIVLAFVLRASYEKFSPSRYFTWVMRLAAVSLPVVLACGIYVKLNAASETPIMRLESQYKVGDKLVYSQSWDYVEAYDAYVSKYFSKPVQADTVVGSQGFELDSVRFTFNMTSVKTDKTMTLKAVNGQLDVKAVLEAHTE